MARSRGVRNLRAVPDSRDTIADEAFEATVILIDDRPTRGRRGMDWYHMATDDLNDSGLEELHTMATRLGLRPQWLHHHPGLPHYDVPDEVKREAITLGASEVTTRELVKRCKRSGGKTGGPREAAGGAIGL